MINLIIFYLFLNLLCNFFTKHPIIDKIFLFNHYIVSSGSMEPGIKINDIVIVQKLSTLGEKQQLKPEKDIVIFKNEKITHLPIIHRIIENDITNKKIVTKGDNNSTIDLFPTKYDDILAKHIYTIGRTNILIFFLFSSLFVFILFVI